MAVQQVADSQPIRAIDLHVTLLGCEGCEGCDGGHVFARWQWCGLPINQLRNVVFFENKLGLQFAKFLEVSDDVARFAKLPEQFGFVIEYTDAMGNLRHYEPDFVVVDNDGISRRQRSS